MFVRMIGSTGWMLFASVFAITVVAASVPPSPIPPVDTGHYTASDDASWAVVSDRLSKPETQVFYDEFMEQCRRSCYRSDKDDEWNRNEAHNHCTSAEENRLTMNRLQPQSVRNYTKVGFQKIRAPDEVFRIIQEFWENNKDHQTVEWTHSTPYHNTWDAPPTILRIDNRTLTGGGADLFAAIANAARDAMQNWTGLPQAASSVYGIRVYHNNSILTPHVDRLPLVSSAIINVAQDVDEPWFLEVYDHDGVAHNVSMAPGDLVLYESHSVIHGRPFPMRGKFYANIFVHFEPLGPPPDVSDQVAQDINFPPYLIRGSSWESEWRSTFPNGWELFQDPVALVGRGDLTTVRYLAQTNASKLLDHDGTAAQWRPIHEASRSKSLEIVQFLIEELGADVNTPCFAMENATPLKLARKFAGRTHPLTQYLESKGGIVLKNADGSNDEDDNDIEKDGNDEAAAAAVADEDAAKADDENEDEL